MTEINIDDELEQFLPPLDRDAFEELAKRIEEDGWTDPLVVWSRGSILVDGHNRYRIWERDYLGHNDKRNIAPPVIVKDFANKAAAMEYMLSKQKARRNLTKEQRDTIIRKLYAEEKRQSPGAPKGNANAQKTIVSNDTIESQAKEAKEDTKSTAEKVADAVGVSPSTVNRVVRQQKTVKPKKPDSVTPSIGGFPKAAGPLLRFIDDWFSKLGKSNCGQHKELIKRVKGIEKELKPVEAPF